MTTPALKPVYPAELERDVTLHDGSIAHVRAIKPADESLLLAFLVALPDEDRRTRFFSLSTNLAGIAHQEADADYQAHGLATILLGQLAEAAASHGIETFEAFVLPENRRMLEVFRQSGFPLETHYDCGTVEVTFPTSLTTVPA